MAIAVPSYTNDPGLTQRESVSAYSSTAGFFTSGISKETNASQDAYETSRVVKSYSTLEYDSAFLFTGTFFYSSFNTTYRNKSVLLFSGESTTSQVGGGVTTSTASADPFLPTALPTPTLAVGNTSIGTSTREDSGTGTTTAEITVPGLTTESFSDPARTITGTAPITQTVTETALVATKTVTESFLTFSTSERTEVSAHAVTVIVAEIGERLFAMATGSVRESTFAKLSAKASAVDSYVRATWHNSVVVTAKASHVSTASGTSALTASTTFLRTAGLTETVTEQFYSSAGKQYSTRTATRAVGSFSTATQTLTTGYTTVSGHVAGQTSNPSTTVRHSVSTTGLFSGTYHDTFLTFLRLATVTATAQSTVANTFYSTVQLFKSLSGDAFNSGTEWTVAGGYTFTESGTSVPFVWAGTGTGSHSGHGRVNSAGAVVPAAALEMSDAGLGLAGWPAGWEPGAGAALYATARREGSAVVVPVWEGVRTSAGTDGFGYKASMSLDSVTASRGNSSTFESTSFVWALLLTGERTQFAGQAANRAYLSEGTLYHRRAVDVSLRDGTGGETALELSAVASTLTVPAGVQAVALGRVNVGQLGTGGSRVLLAGVDTNNQLNFTGGIS